MNYLSIKDIDSISEWVSEARNLKEEPLAFSDLGKEKTIGLLFLTPV